MLHLLASFGRKRDLRVSSMMLRKSTVVALSILVAVATAHPYNSEWNNAARYRWNDLFAARAQDVGARVRSQARVADVEKTSCATVTETRPAPKRDSYKVRVCAADAEDAPNTVCLGTRVTPCCPAPDFSLGNLQSSATVDINGEDVTVRFYLTQDPTAGEVCFRLDDAHQRAETCSRSRLAGVSCLPPCSTITTTCFNNTLTGDSSSCDGNVCQCKTGYLPPDCCQCDTTNFYLPDCRPFCRGNCSLFRPADLGGCLTCRAGFTGAPECCECEPGKTYIDGVCKCDANLRPDGTCAEGALEPDCCECDTTGNATHAFYRTASGECIPFCKSNCAVIGSSGCTTCKTGFMTEPECCQCEPGRTEVNGVCKCDANLKPDGTCAEGALEPDCCECDTAGNATHAFYRTPSGECKPYCDNNCAGSVGFGCSTCKAGFMSPPECCQCVPGRDEVAGVCKCRANLKPDGTCAEGALEPDCCECDTTGNTTHAFYKNENDECIPFCQSNCAAIGVRGCLSCKTGFEAVPECCRCEPGREEVNGICKCSANLRPDGSCIPEAKPEDCCECITGYQRNPTTGRCEPERCDKQQQLFFYIDATASNTFENFCPLMVVMQMLVAAFNPSSTSGTQIASLLFSDNVKNKAPSPVFDMNTPCSDAVQGSSRSLSSLMIDFGACLDNDRNYDSSLFPSSCGEGTSAVKGLQEILRLASTSTRSSAEGAIVMLTDGVIIDDASKRTEVLNNLKSAGISTLIAAGIDEADEANLRLYTSSDNILVGDDPVQLGIDIVNKMQERGIVCQDHADNITRSLNDARGSNLIDFFCRCHRKGLITRPVCQRKYPTCGGSLSFGLPNLPSTSTRARTQNNDALEYMNQLLIEEEILAAVEKVLEQRHHG